MQKGANKARQYHTNAVQGFRARGTRSFLKNVTRLEEIRARRTPRAMIQTAIVPNLLSPVRNS